MWSTASTHPAVKLHQSESQHIVSHSVCTVTGANTPHDHNLMLYIHSAEAKHGKKKNEKIGKG